MQICGQNLNQFLAVSQPQALFKFKLHDLYIFVYIMIYIYLKAFNLKLILTGKSIIRLSLLIPNLKVKNLMQQAF